MMQPGFEPTGGQRYYNYDEKHFEIRGLDTYMSAVEPEPESERTLTAIRLAFFATP